MPYCERRTQNHTLTLPVVTHGVKIAFVATGGGKKEIMKAIFEGGNGLPCALVNEGARERCSWFVDNAAVEGVSYPQERKAGSRQDLTRYDFAVEKDGCAGGFFGSGVQSEDMDGVLKGQGFISGTSYHLSSPLVPLLLGGEFLNMSLRA
ncbi:hypothetical protein EYC84_007678 [Monilinia fructicola]|uniref:Glucosamine/galactosamine-6-phosphate isomerase domain-containing protein n=1 Tax=Monilinia fructicola TaxID=38448 RepID=A0A5M9JH99_MONFR|nr:hypothetical protein EYC84_007678 [Monilinia fructicola]